MQTLLIWQLVDSAFPSGGFAHSWGLEAAYQAGEVTTDAELERFLADSIWQAGHGMLPFVNAAHDSPAAAATLDDLCDGFLVNAVANRASRAQGKALLSGCARIWPGADVRALDARGALPCAHLAPVTGAAMRTLGIERAVAQQMTLFVAARGVLAAAVRLGIVGPFRAQQLQHACGPRIAAVRVRCERMEPAHSTQTAPLADLLQSAHDRLYSRLFQS
ncbi:MAG TPA: urease accessory UreF family protein [Vicinamibacterales bacterium]|nr:urease accessory UreF family protein [Vicinamibacterales bacterium]